MFVVIDSRPVKNPYKEHKRLKRALKKLDGSEVPATTKARFTEEYGNISAVQWERQDYFDEATFTKDGKVMKAYFDTDGELVGTVNEDTFNNIPQKAGKIIQKEYPDYKVGDVVYYTDNLEQEGDIYLFGNEMESASNYFVELSNINKRLIVKVTPEGDVSFFKELKLAK
jgi:hypothetical protein